MIKKISAVFLFCAVVLVSYAQSPKISVYAKSNYAFPSIEDHESRWVGLSLDPNIGYRTSVVDVAIIDRKSTPKVSFDFGAAITFDLKERISISTGIGVYKIRYIQNEYLTIGDNQIPDEGLPFGMIIQRDASGMIINRGSVAEENMEVNQNIGGSLPFNYNLTYTKLSITSSYSLQKRLKIKLGMDISLLLKSKREHTQVVFDHEQNIGVFPTTNPTDNRHNWVHSSDLEMIRTDDTSGDGLNSLIIGIVTGFEYSLFKKISITADYNRSLSNIYKDTNTSFTNDYKAKNNMVSLGVSYQIK